MPDYTPSNDRLGILHGITQLDASPPPVPKPSSQGSSTKKTRSPPPPASDMEGTDQPRTSTDDKDRERRKSKFRFKKKHRHSHRHDDGEKDGHDRRSKRRKHDHHAPLQDDPTEYDDTYIPNAASWKYATDPDAAFRESLFDAMADDEGAAFWEGVYGQPAHIYPRPGVQDNRGHLEQMTDEEYARYVREKMYEKTHEHIVEERKRREEKKERDKRRTGEERHAWQEAERERTRKEERRRERREQDRLQQRWRDYINAWGNTLQDGKSQAGKKDFAIPWPVESGRLHDVTKAAVEEFILAAPLEEGRSIQDVFKVERVRWHPDKAQQRWGKRGLDVQEARAITAVFQTIDTLYRAKAT